MDDWGRVDVIMPTHNRRDVLVHAVASALGQSYPNLRCIVVDNGSTDGTASVLESLANDRVVVVVDDKPLGCARARNLGMAASKGSRWLAFLDDDDLWAPTKVERQLAIMAANPDARWSATGSVHVSQELGVRAAVRLVTSPGAASDELVIPSAELRQLLKDENRIPTGSSSVLVARDLIDQVGDFFPEITTNEDWDMWLRLATESPLAYIDQPMVAARIWEGQMSNQGLPFVSCAAVVRARNFPGEGPLPTDYAARWHRETARRRVAGRQRLPAAQSYVAAAWVGRDPGQLAYALAAAISPSSTERRLRRLESTRTVPEGWDAYTEQWLAPWR
jgi:glycosyltransferase involved in cell wall biosynthesis